MDSALAELPVSIPNIRQKDRGTSLGSGEPMKMLDG